MSLWLRKWDSSTQTWVEVQTWRPQELVTNAGIETASPLGWIGAGFAGGVGSIARDTSEHFRGDASLKITQTNTVGYYFGNQPLILTSNAHYTVRAKIKIKTGNVPSVRASVFLGAFSNNLTLNANLNIVGEWQTVECFNWSPGADAGGVLNLEVQTTNATDAIVWFDDISIVPVGKESDLKPLQLIIDENEGQRLTLEEITEKFYDNSWNAETELQLWDDDRLIFQGKIIDPECAWEGARRITYTAIGLKLMLAEVAVRFPDTDTGELRRVYNAPRGDFEYHADRYERSVGQIAADILDAMDSEVRKVLRKSGGRTYTTNIMQMTVVPPMTELSAENVKGALDKVMQFLPEWGWRVNPAFTEIGFGGNGYGDIPYGSPTERILEFYSVTSSPVRKVSLLKGAETEYGFGENGFGDIGFGSPPTLANADKILQISISDSTEMCYTAVELQGDDELETIALWNPNNEAGSYLEPDWDRTLESTWSLQNAFTPGLAGSYGRVFRFFKLKVGTIAFPEGARVLPTRAFGQEIALLTHYSFAEVQSVEDLNVGVPGAVTPDGHIRLNSPIWEYNIQGQPSSGCKSKYLLMRFMHLNSSGAAMTVRTPASGYEGTAYSLRTKERLFTWYSGAWKHRDIWGVTWEIPADRLALLPYPWNGSGVLYDPYLQLPDWYDPVTGADPLELIGKSVTVSGIGTYTIRRYLGDALLLWNFPGCAAGTGFLIHLQNDSPKLTTLAERLLAMFKDIRYLGQFTESFLDYGFDMGDRVEITDGKVQWEESITNPNPMRAPVYRIEFDFLRRTTTVYLTPQSAISPDELARRLFREDRTRLFELEHFTTTGGGSGDGGTGGGGGEPNTDIDKTALNIWL